MNSWIDRQPTVVVVRIGLVTSVVLSILALDACGKSPSAVVADTANHVAQRLMQPLVQKNASNQAEQMVELLSDKPACDIFKQRLLEAGKGSPYEGATESKLAHTQQDACAAGCCK